MQLKYRNGKYLKIQGGPDIQLHTDILQCPENVTLRDPTKFWMKFQQQKLSLISTELQLDNFMLMSIHNEKTILLKFFFMFFFIINHTRML